MYDVSAQGVDGRMMNVYYYYILCSAFRAEVLHNLKSPFVARLRCVQSFLFVCFLSVYSCVRVPVCVSVCA